MPKYNSFENDVEKIKWLEQQLADKDKEIKDLKQDINQYKVWHKLQKGEIEKLQTELETYRPTKLKGNGQCVCSICGQREWTDWCVKYDGKIYCDKCFKQVKTRDYLLRHQVCEEIKEKAQFIDHYKDTEGIIHYTRMYLIQGITLDQIEQGE